MGLGLNVREYRGSKGEFDMAVVNRRGVLLARLMVKLSFTSVGSFLVEVMVWGLSLGV